MSTRDWRLTPTRATRRHKNTRNVQYHASHSRRVLESSEHAAAGVAAAMAAKKQKTHVVSDDAYKRALLKKVRIASAVLEELDRRVALGQKARDADAGDTERKARAQATIASALEKLKALGVRDDECESARAAANAVLEQKLKKRAAREREAAKDAAKRQRRGDGASAMGTVKSDAAWALHAIAKTASGGADARAMDTKEIETRARATAADAERVNLKTCNAALWSIAKIASRVNDEHACAQALGKAFEALLRRSAAFSAAETDARAASTTLWAAASTQRTTVGAFTDDGAMRRAVNVAAEALAANADKANAQDAANALWGAAKLRRSLDPACARALIATLTTTPVVTDGTVGVKLEELTIALWAMATFAGDGMRNVRACAAPLMKRAKEATKKPKTWSPQAIANAAWAAGKLATTSGDDTEDDATHSEACVKDAKQLVTSLIPAAKLAALTAQGFAHVLAAAAAVDVDARLVGDLAKFTVIGLKTHASTLTSTDLASVVEAVRDLKLCSSMSDGTKLAEDIARAIERGVDTFDWQACGRLDLAIEDVVSAQDVERLRESLSARGKEVCDAVDAKRLDVERGAADALLSLPGDYSALTAPFDANAATMLVVDDRYRLVTKKLRRVGWQTTMWQRFSCGEHAKGASWLERDDGNLEPFATAVVRMPPTKASLDMVLNAVAANVRFGGRVWIYGAAAEGVGAVVADLPKVRFSSRLLYFLFLLFSSHWHTLAHTVHACVRAFTYTVLHQCRVAAAAAHS